jgi:hypothetical protein
MYFKLPADGMSQKPKRVAKNKLDIHVVVIDGLYFLFAVFEQVTNFTHELMQLYKFPKFRQLRKHFCRLV